MKEVNVIITRETAAVAQRGFGLPLIVATGQASDTDYIEVGSLDNIPPSLRGGVAYDMAAAMFGQSPRPPTVAMVGFRQGAVLSDALDELVEKSNDWYFLLCDDSSRGVMNELSRWAAANGKLYFASPTEWPGGINISNDRTVIMYHSTDVAGGVGDATAAAGWVGRCAPEQPGSITWAYKSINGLVPAAVSDDEIRQLADMNVNTYIRRRGMEYTTPGVASDGTYIDIVRMQDWMTARIEERVFRLLVNSGKLPYDVRGVSMVLAEVEAVMREGVANGIIALDEDGNGIYKVTGPDVADISPADKADRLLPDIEFSFVLAGAVHRVTIRGVIKL